MDSIRDLLNTDVEILITSGKISPKKLALLCSQLSITLKAGLPLVAALELAGANHKDPTLRRMVLEAAGDVRAGQTLSRAMQRQEPLLPATFLPALRAGEASGDLGEAFGLLQHYYERSAAISSKIRSAMAYPLLLCGAAVAVVAVILLYAIPVFTTSFAVLGTALPLPTRILIALSDFLKAHSLLLGAGAAIFCIAVILFGKTGPGRRTGAFLALWIPGLGRISRMQAAVQFSTTLSSLLKAGVSLAEAARVTAGATGNRLIAGEIHAACQGVLEGKSLAEGLKQSRYLPSLLVEMTAAGEAAGRLEDTLQVVCDYYTREAETAVKTALGLLEPCLTVLLALLVVFILLAVYLPLFSMYGFM